MIGQMKQDFIDPDDMYTPIPFWFWNDKLSEDEIIRQIEDFKDKGVMGFVIHPRIGIPKEIQYLSDTFMTFVKCAVETAAKNGMKVVLYDEAMYPSGSAHGMVVDTNPEYASIGLRMISHICKGKTDFTPKLNKGDRIISALAVEVSRENTINLDRVIKLQMDEGKVTFEPPNDNEWQMMLFVECLTHGTIRGIHFGEDDNEAEAPLSADLLNPDAVKTFIEITHECYYSWLGEYFGDTIIAFFTDEPAIMGRHWAKWDEPLVPWTRGFLDWYIANGNDEKCLPLLFGYEAGEETEVIRKRYRQTVNKKLVATYYKPISDWCSDHNIALTGHPEESQDIGLQEFFHIPGQDLISRYVAPGRGVIEGHSTMAKCSSDAARHTGKSRNGNECFGCCGQGGSNDKTQWLFTADEMKWYMDWLFVRGVNLLYPHAFFYSIEGARKWERPPDVGPNNSWWQYYHQVSDYIKRMSWVMTDSINVTEVAVLCQEDCLPWKIVQPLYEHQIEFNYLEEDLLVSDQCSTQADTIVVAGQKYSVIVIEDFQAVCEAAKEKLKTFEQAGGTVLVYDQRGQCHHEMKLEKIREYEEIVPAIEKYIPRDVLVTPQCNEIRVSHVKKEDKHLFVLTNEGETTFEGEISLYGLGEVEKWDAWQGIIETMEVSRVKDHRTYLNIVLDRRESIIIYMDPQSIQQSIEIKVEKSKTYQSLQVIEPWKMYHPLSTEWVELEVLKSWDQWEELKYYSGTVTYESSFEYDGKDSNTQLEIDLGQVYEIAHLYINGKSAGVKMWAPYKFDITHLIKSGSNNIKVEITNSTANSLSKLSLPSGLIGQVEIIEIKETID